MKTENIRAISLVKAGYVREVIQDVRDGEIQGYLGSRIAALKNKISLIGLRNRIRILWAGSESRHFTSETDPYPTLALKRGIHKI